MVTHKKAFGKAKTLPAGLAISTLIAMVLTVLLAAGMTQLILGNQISMSAVGYWAMVVLPLISALSAWLAVGMVKRKRMQVCVLAATLYFAALSLVNILCFGGQFQGAWVTALLIYGGALCVAFWGLKGEGKGKKMVKKYRRR